MTEIQKGGDFHQRRRKRFQHVGFCPYSTVNFKSREEEENEKHEIAQPVCDCGHADGIACWLRP
jgi:hypothetical protein